MKSTDAWSSNGLQWLDLKNGYQFSSVSNGRQGDKPRYVVLVPAHPSPDMHLLMMTSSTGNIFRVTGHFCGEFTGHRFIARTKASD